MVYNVEMSLLLPHNTYQAMACMDCVLSKRKFQSCHKVIWVWLSAPIRNVCTLSLDCLYASFKYKYTILRKHIHIGGSERVSIEMFATHKGQKKKWKRNGKIMVVLRKIYTAMGLELNRKLTLKLHKPLCSICVCMHKRVDRVRAKQFQCAVCLCVWQVSKAFLI